jgi:hypothetical protein
LLKIRKVERDCAEIAGAPKHLRDWLVALEFFKFAKGPSAVVRAIIEMRRRLSQCGFVWTNGRTPTRAKGMG